MNILVSGSTGLVGTALISALTAAGHEVVRLVRSKARNPSKELVGWDPAANFIDAAGLEGLDAIVHLAGEPIAAARWSDAVKARIRDSRIIGTRLLCNALAHIARPPAIMVCASAIGYYGDRGDEVLTEESTAGNDFLAGVCREWEAACEPARQKGIRVANLRFGVILSPQGGALAKMLTPFKMGVGGVIGSGRQHMSCISIDDCVGVIVHALTNPAVTGPVNVVGPESVTNYGFHEDAREGARAADGVSHAGVRRTTRVWRNGRRLAAFEQPRGSKKTARHGISIPTRHAGSSTCATCPLANNAGDWYKSAVAPRVPPLRDHHNSTVSRKRFRVK